MLELILLFFSLAIDGALGVSGSDRWVNVHYETNCKQPEIQAEQQKLQESAIVDTLAEKLNALYISENQLELRLICEDTNEDGAHYDPEQSTIFMPYEYSLWVVETLEETGNQVSDLQTFIQDVIVHTLYHEATHALIDLFALPITGREENAADEFATLFVLANYEDGARIAKNAADYFGYEAEYYGEPEPADLYGMHALDIQRFFAIRCLVFGSDPEAHEALMLELDIEEERKDICIEDFDYRTDAWGILLEEYTR